jgi:hypothetical protein
MGKKKNKAGIQPENQKEITTKLDNPTGSINLVKNPDITKTLGELDKLRKVNSAYQEAIKMTQYHLTQCHARTGAITTEDVEYCFNLTKRMAENACN